MKSDKEFLENYESLSPQPDRLDSFLMNSRKMWLTEIYITPSKLNTIEIPTMLLQGDRDLIKICISFSLKKLRICAQQFIT